MAPAVSPDARSLVQLNMSARSTKGADNTSPCIGSSAHPGEAYNKTQTTAGMGSTCVENSFVALLAKVNRLS